MKLLNNFSTKFYLKKIVFKFFLVGIVNTIFGYTLFATLLLLGLHYSLALALATIIGVLFNFKTSAKFIFNNQSYANLLKFIAGYIFVYIFNVFGVSVFIYLGLSEFLSGAIMILPAAVTAFLIQRFWVFKK